MEHQLVFVPIVDAETTAVEFVLSSDEMLAYMDLPRWKSPLELSELYQACVSGSASIYLLFRNGNPVGIAGLSHICIKHRFAYITCGILPQYQRSGFAEEAVTRVEYLAFQALGLHRLEAQVHEDNCACISFLRKIGYAEEGRMKGNLLVDGAFYDSVLFAKINFTQC